MKLYIDLNKKRLVESNISTVARSTPVIFTRGDIEPLELHLLIPTPGGASNYTEQEIDPQKEALVVAIGVFTPEKTVYAISDGFSPNPVADDGGYIVILPTNTIAMAEALKGQPQIQPYLEVEWTDADGNITTVLRTTCTVNNDIIDGPAPIEQDSKYYTKDEITELLKDVVRKVAGSNWTIGENGEIAFVHEDTGKYYPPYATGTTLIKLAADQKPVTVANPETEQGEANNE